MLNLPSRSLRTRLGHRRGLYNVYRVASGVGVRACLHHWDFHKCQHVVLLPKAHNEADGRMSLCSREPSSNRALEMAVQQMRPIVCACVPQCMQLRRCQALASDLLYATPLKISTTNSSRTLVQQVGIDRIFWLERLSVTPFASTLVQRHAFSFCNSCVPSRHYVHAHYILLQWLSSKWNSG